MASNPRLENLAQTTSGSGFPNRASGSSTGYFNGAPSVSSRSSPNVWIGHATSPQNGLLETTIQAPAGSSSSSLSSPSSSTHDSKFQSSLSNLSMSGSIGSTATSGANSTSNTTFRADFPFYEPSPMSLPVRIGSSQPTPLSTSSPTIGAPPSVPLSQLSDRNAPSTSAPPEYSYDLAGSNVILKRGTIKPVQKQSSSGQINTRSASTPVTIQASQRNSLVSTPDLGSGKLDKAKKSKKMNSSSLSAAPPPSSVASTPVADGNIEIAAPIVDRWPDALYQGWMKKRNKGKESTAKKRYLVVKTNCIEYYSDPLVRFEANFAFYKSKNLHKTLQRLTRNQILVI